MNPYFLDKHEQPGISRVRQGLHGILLAGALLGVTGFNISCGGGSHVDNPPTPPPPTAGSVIGTVKNAVSGKPIPGATVTDGSATVTTGTDGAYALTATPSSRKLITIKAASFGDNQQITNVVAGKSNKLDVALVPATVLEIPDLALDTTLSVPGSPAQVALPAHGLVTSSGGAPTFPVKASLAPIDPSNNPRLMPGDYTTSTGEQLESFGALDVTFKDQTGAPLNLAPGQFATIQIPLASFHWGGTPPLTVPAYYFDTSTGRWVKEGTLTLAGTGIDQYYVGTVGHFTTWNADNVAATTCITGKVVRTDGSPEPDAVVTATGVSYLGVSSIVSDSNGLFQLPVMSNQTFTVTASHGFLSTGTPILTVTNPYCSLNGTFSDTRFWTQGTGWAITAGSPGSAAHTPGTANTVALSENPIGLVASTNYTLAYTISGRTAGTLQPSLGTTNGTSRSANGTVTETISCPAANALLAFTPSSNFDGSITNVTLTPVGVSGCQSVGNLIIDGQLVLTGVMRDFSPSAPYQFPYSLPIVNGTFDTVTPIGWTTDPAWTIAGGVATCGSHSGTVNLTQSQPVITSGMSYKVSYTLNRTSASGNLTCLVGGTSGPTHTTGAQTDTIIAAATNTNLVFRADATWQGTIDNVTVSVGDGHPPNVIIDANTPFPIYNRVGGDALLALSDGPWWNPDFETSDSYPSGTGIVNVNLGSNNKPVFSGKAWAQSGVVSSASFDAWWTDFPHPHGPSSDPLNTAPYQGLYSIPLTEVLPATTPKTYSYNNQSQFPNDGMYQGNYVGNNRGSSGNSPVRGNPSGHNFHYTYELHLMFTYRTGQTFAFTGDDDVYVFINKLLVIDLGGIHGNNPGSVTLTATSKATDNVTPLNLVDGQVYQFDFFYCERHTTESHMKITTSIPLNDTLIPN